MFKTVIRLLSVILLLAMVTDGSAQSLSKTVLVHPKLSKVKMKDYEELVIHIGYKCSFEGKRHINNPIIQKYMVQILTATDSSTLPLEKKVCKFIEKEPTIDAAFAKLKRLKGYDVFFDDDSTTFTTEMAKCPDCKRTYRKKGFRLTEENGIVNLDHGILFDAKTGKMITPTDILTNTTLKGDQVNVLAVERNVGEGADSSSNSKSYTIVSVHSIDKSSIGLTADNKQALTIGTDSPLLTPYAKSLLTKIKDYKLKTQRNEFGDILQFYHFYRVNDSYNNATVCLPYKLNGCDSTEKIRKRMLNVMFGKSDGDLGELVNNGVKAWFSSSYSRGAEMLLQCGDGLVSFGFENKEIHNNSQNTFIVFDRTTGNEIDVNDLIQDKDGFLKLVNRHQYYMAGFLFDSTTATGNLKVGPSLRNYLKHSGGYLAPFKGWNEFPTSWWFAFSRLDDFVPVEFNTPTSRIFLNYEDVKPLINPKYLDLLEKAVKSIPKED